MTIKPIETSYAGHRFRSRLEARWAVAFDTLDIPWHYEPEGFETPAGRYLPDFWLPAEKTWVEVKGSVPTEAEIAKCRHVAAVEHARNGHNFVILIGEVPRSPAFDTVVGPLGIQCVMWSNPPKAAAIARLFDGEHIFICSIKGAHPHLITAAADDRYGPDLIGFATECRMFWLPSTGTDRLTVKELPQALSAARSARFEHGERP